MISKAEKDTKAIDLTEDSGTSGIHLDHVGGFWVAWLDIVTVEIESLRQSMQVK